MRASGQFAEYLSRNSLKMTRERRAILDKVLALQGHFDVDELHALLGKSGLAVSRATLYRTLPRLVEAGLVHKVDMARGQARYEPMFGRHHHDHMVCLGCGQILEFESREIERLQEAVCRRKRFRMTGHTHQIQGYCSICVRRRPDGSGGNGAGRGRGVLPGAPVAFSDPGRGPRPDPGPSEARRQGRRSLAIVAGRSGGSESSTADTSLRIPSARAARRRRR